MTNTSRPAVTDAFVAAFVARLLAGAEEFNRSIIGLPIPESPKLLSKSRASWAAGALQEELTEFQDAQADKDILESADALIDLIYFALGRLVEMGIPARMVFDEVQRANMGKERGELSKRTGSLGYDAIKPEGWQPPDHSALLTFSAEDLAKARLWDSLSPVLKKVAELRAKKGQDYNAGPQLKDYFPFGHLSYAQMVHLKTLRIHSLLAVLQSGKQPNFEGLLDTLEDLINYTTFYAEAVEDGSVNQPMFGGASE